MRIKGLSEKLIRMSVVDVFLFVVGFLINCRELSRRAKQGLREDT